MNSYVIGIDFGTDSVRALLVDSISGEELEDSVSIYDKWSKGMFCKPKKNQFRQHPSDHLIGLENCVKELISKSKINPDQVKALSIDTTGSSPIPVNEEGNALVFEKGFENNPNAMVILWKDHSAIKEAKEINDLVAKHNLEYLKYSGGVYSSEWFWAKILHIIRIDESVMNSAYSWMEHCDYLTFNLIEESNLSNFKRSRCAAGHKAMWHKSWNGLPSKEFLNSLDPYLGNLRDNLYNETYSSDYAAGSLCGKWAKKLGLNTKTIIGVGTFDAHAAAIGAKVDKNFLVKVMGTSTCDITIGDSKLLSKKVVRGICGQVDGSVIPGYYGLEAGQSAFGDFLAWFKEILQWPLENILKKIDSIDNIQKNQIISICEEKLIEELTDAASKIKDDSGIPNSLDWINGRRTPDANQNLKAALSNLTLGSGSPEIFLSLIYSICFGSKKIIDRFELEGVEIKKIIGVGGIARKSPFIMQTLSNVLDLPVSICKSDQTSALGTAIFAAVSSGIYKSIHDAIKIMGSKSDIIYFPEKSEVLRLKILYNKYNQFSRFIEDQLNK